MLRDPRWPRFIRSLEIFTDEQQVQLNVLETEKPVARRFFDWCAETDSRASVQGASTTRAVSASAATRFSR